MTPRIISIDTTAEFGSLALVGDGVVLEEMPVHSTEGFSPILYTHLRRLLARHGWKAADADCFAAAAGPGSFTGIRVGLAAVKGLGEALHRPVVAVSNLQAIAWHGRARLRGTIIDARRGEIYCAVYSASLELVSPEVVTRLALWLESLPAGELELLSTDFGPFRQELARSRFASGTVEVPRALAGAIGRIAALRLAAGLAPAAAAVDANYLRCSDAELFWKDR